MGNKFSRERLASPSMLRFEIMNFNFSSVQAGNFFGEFNSLLSFIEL